MAKPKKRASAETNLARKLRAMLGEVHELKYALEGALSRANRHLSVLAFNAEPDPKGDRFRAWCAAELDKRVTGKADIPGIPAVVRSANLKDLEAWVSEPLRRAEAARAAAYATCFDGDTTRNVGARWPALNRDDPD